MQLGFQQACAEPAGTVEHSRFSQTSHHHMRSPDGRVLQVGDSHAQHMPEDDVSGETQADPTKHTSTRASLNIMLVTYYHHARGRFERATLVACLLAISAIGTTAQDEAPRLTDTQRLTFQTLSQQIEIAQLRAQLAQRDFDAARDAIGKLVLSLRIDGYTLDLATLTYRPNPQETKDK